MPKNQREAEVLVRGMHGLNYCRTDEAARGATSCGSGTESSQSWQS